MNATITWNANTEPDLAGYQVFHGISSGVYTPADTVTVLAPTTTYTYVGLDVGIIHYFAVKAFDTTGNLSAFSAEVSKIEPFPVYASFTRVGKLRRDRQVRDTDASHLVAGFMAEAIGLNVVVIPPPPEQFPIYEAIGGFMIV